MTAEHETEVAQYKEHKQFREDVKEFEELAKSKNVNFKEALTNYVNIEKQFASEPAQGFKQLLSNIRMTPPQAISHILQAFNVTPQALAAHIADHPNDYTPLARTQQQEQPQPQEDPRMKVLEEKLQAMELQSAADKYITPFIAEHPRYHELEQDIAFFLQSGKIPANMSPADKLAAAYDMAERINPSSNGTSTQTQAAPQSRVDEDFNGTKSVKSSPGSVLNISEPTRKMSMRDMLEDEIKRLKKA
jgi:hypothetical protein